MNILAKNVSNLMSDQQKVMNNLAQNVSNLMVDEQKGSPCISNDKFSDEIGKEAAKKLRAAMKGFGTNEKHIIDVTVSFTRNQRLKIKEIYYNEFKRDLISDLHSELDGKFRKLCIGFWLNYGEFSATQIAKCLGGIFSKIKMKNVDVLSLTLLTKTDEEIQQIMIGWKECRYDGFNQPIPLNETIKKDTQKLFGESYLSQLLNSIFEQKRERNVDTKQAALDAEMLNRYLMQESTEKTIEKFIQIFSVKSWSHIREISKIFAKISKQYTLISAIKKKFGDEDISKALCIMVEFCLDPHNFYASQLKKAMEGLGSDDDKLITIILERAEIDLESIINVFSQTYGDGKTFREWVDDDLSGDYKELVLAVTQSD